MQRNILLRFSLMIAALVFTGCTPPTDVSNAPANSNSNTASDQTTSQPPEPDYSSVIITIPLIDAMMSDQQFRERARTEAQLTDEEMNKL
ncbi:MAG: hypothetical protein H0V76_03270, partial [Blastocatellia bacterium]|nr:hypothetical protein [Blastocatellia bacterium]